jgi:hypothetical protein
MSRPARIASLAAYLAVMVFGASRIWILVEIAPATAEARATLAVVCLAWIAAAAGGAHDLLSR